MVRFWVCLLEFWQIHFGRWKWVIRLRMFAADFCQVMADVWTTTFGAFLRLFGRRNKPVRFTWWTYYIAVTQSLRLARICKSKYARYEIDVDTCLISYERFEGVRSRARAKGYIKLTNEGIHDRWK